MSIILLETHHQVVRKIKKRAFVIHVILVLMLLASVSLPWISKVKNDLIRASYGVVRHYLVEFKARQALLEILRNKPLTVGQALEVADVVIDEAKANKVPVHMVLGIIDLESEFNPDARSSEGARGLMQVMPDTWDRYVSAEPLKGLKAKHNPAMNVRVGVRYLGDLIKQYGDWRKVLKEYGGFVKKSPDKYVRIVMANAERYRVQLGDVDGSGGSKSSPQ
jgi:soluble lytic murein transglycosylase-like protein